ncbi:MAG: adenylate/guanylate cyclase domain-containing protein [Caldilineaceae bacterium]
MLYRLAATWSWISGVGAKGLGKRDRRHQRLTNQSIVLIASTTLAFNLFYAFYDLRLLAPAIILNAGAIVLYVFLLWQINRGNLAVAKMAFTLVGHSQLFLLTAMFSPSCGLQLFYIAGGPIGGMIASPSEKAVLYGFPLLSGILLVASELMLPADAGLLPVPEQFLAIVHLSSVSGTFALVSILAWLFYSDILRAEAALEKEYARSEGLLANILPRAIIDRLKTGEKNIADGVPEATIIFADLVGFTTLAGLLSPSDLIRQLNAIFSCFDDIVGQRHVEKIKTIGDAYMIACGLPEQRADHAVVAAEVALSMLDEVQALNERGEISCQVRIGMHSGPVVAGVIGERKFAYDVWGDTVNTASRMESHGVPGRIQVSQRTRDLVNDHYLLEPRGVVNIKGKGEMSTYLLTCRRALAS